MGAAGLLREQRQQRAERPLGSARRPRRMGRSRRGAVVCRRSEPDGRALLTLGPSGQCGGSVLRAWRWANVLWRDYVAPVAGCSRPQGWARRCSALKGHAVPSPGFSLGTAGLLVTLFAVACQPAPRVTTLEAPTAPGTQSADPVLATDPVTGDLLLAWVAGDTAGWHVYFARSRDGGGTWSTPARVTDREHDIRPHGESSPRLVATPNVVAIVWTNSVPAALNGGAVIVWDVGPDGKPALFVAHIAPDGRAGPPVAVAGSAGADHPEAATLGDGRAVVAWTERRGDATRVRLVTVTP